MTAATMQGFAATHRTPMTVSVIGHVLLLVALSTSVVFVPKPTSQPMAIEAVVIDESATRRAAEQQRQADLVQQRQREAEQQRQREAEQQRQRELAAERQRDQERAEAEQRRQAEAAAAERRRQAELEEQRRAEAARAEQERQRREAEAAAQRERERQEAAARAKAEAERQEQARREAELAAALAAEEELLAVRQSGAMSRYITLIAQKVERNWQQPASAVPGVECEVSVRQLPGGDVVSAQVTRCNGDAAVQRSVENAVFAASPLPMPDDQRLFERNLRFIFKPQVYD